MGAYFRRRVPLGRRLWLNLSRSGVSVSWRPTDRVTLNSRGRVTVRGGHGWGWRSGR